MSRQGTFDFETASEAGHVWNEATRSWDAPRGARYKGLKTVGAAAYSEHPSTRVLTLSYKLPGVWFDQYDRPRTGGVVVRWRPSMGHPPQELFDFLAGGGILEAHKLMFEWLIWQNVCVTKYGWPSLEPWAHQLRCSMMKARVNAYPGPLGPLGDVLQLSRRKDKDGTRLLNKFSVPRKPTKGDPRLWITPEEDPEDGERLYRYCDDDVLTEEEASEKMHPATDDELLFWMVDQEINRRGVAIDRDAIQDCMAVLEQALEQYGDECREITGFNPTQLKELKGWMAARGHYLDSMDEEALDDALGPGGRIPPHPPGGIYPPRRVLEIRQLIGSASVKKLYAMEHQACGDNRLRDLIAHHGARTGRPTGEGPQPLNLPKAGPELRWCGDAGKGQWFPVGCRKPFKASFRTCPWCSAPAVSAKREWGVAVDKATGATYNPVDTVLEVMRARCLALVEYYFEDALLAISGCVRGLFVAAPGCDFIASDYTAIEGVVIAQLAGEQWRIDAYRNFEPIYLLSASKITGTPLQVYLDYAAQNGAHHPDRQKIGKVAELACLAAETRVLTNRGYVDIVDVRPNDRLWDGVEWVNHGGLVSRGTRDTLLVDGVRMTPDHLINSRGSWKAAKEHVSNASTLSRSLETGSESFSSVTWSGRRPGRASRASWSCASPATPPSRIWSTFTRFCEGRVPGAMLAPKRRPESTSKTSGAMRISSLTTRTAAGCSTEFRRASRAAVQGQPTLDTPITAGGAFEFTRLGFQTSAPSWRTLSPCPVGTSPRLSLIEKRQTAITSPAICSLSPRPRTSRTAEASKSCSVDATPLRPVYDIALAGPRNRFLIQSDSGHLLVHNCGFGGWIGAYRQFGSDGLDEEIKQQILAWRAASPAIVELWGGQTRGAWRDRRQEYYGLEGAAVQAISYPGMTFETHGIAFYMRGDALIVRLPSTRELTYHSPRLSPSTRDYDPPWALQITYLTWNTNPKYGPKGWVPMSTYGGRLAENVTQAVAHDILRFAILNLRAAGYPTVIHVYDEILVEVPEGLGSVEEVERIMSIMPPWAHDWPVRASGGWRGKRYRKG